MAEASKWVFIHSFTYSLFAGIRDDTVMKLSECCNLLAGEYSFRDLYCQFMACIILYQAEKNCAQQPPTHTHTHTPKKGRNLNSEYRAIDRCKTGVTYDPEVEYVC